MYRQNIVFLSVHYPNTPATRTGNHPIVHLFYTIFLIFFFYQINSNDGHTKVIILMFAAYLFRGGMNIVIVDWSPLCAFPWYSHAVLNTRVAARYLAKFIEYLVSRGFRLSKIHLIGFSLGAEIAGFTGKNLKIGKLPRITGKVQYTILRSLN